MQQSPVSSACQPLHPRALAPGLSGQSRLPRRPAPLSRLALAACFCLLAAIVPAHASPSSRAVVALLEMKEMLRADHDDLSSLARAAKPGLPGAEAKRTRLEAGTARFASRRERFLALIPGAKQRFPQQAAILDRARRDVELWSRDLAAMTRPAPSAAAIDPAAARTPVVAAVPVAPREQPAVPAMTRIPAPIPTARAKPAPRLEARGSRLEERLASPVDPSRPSTTIGSSSSETPAADAGRPAAVTHEQIQELASKLKSRMATAAPAPTPTPRVRQTPDPESRDQLRARLNHLMTKFQVSAEPYKYAKVAPATPAAEAVAAKATPRVAAPTRGRDLWQENERIQQRLRQLQRDARPPADSAAATSETVDELVGKPLEPAGGQAPAAEKAALQSRLKAILVGNEPAALAAPATLKPAHQSSRPLEAAPGGKAMARVIRTAERSAIHLEDLDGLVTSMGAPPIAETTSPTGPAEDASESEALMSTGVAASLGVSPESTEAGGDSTETAAEADEEKAPAPRVASAPRPIGLTGVYEIVTDEDTSVDRPDVQDEIGTHNFEGPDGNGESVYQIIRTLAEQLKLNIVIKGVIPGKMLLNVDGQSTWDVLEGVLNDQGLEYELLPGNVLKIWGAGIRPSIQKTYKFAPNQNVREYESLIQSLVFQAQEEAVAPSESSGPQGGLEIPSGTRLEVPGVPGGQGGQGGQGFQPGDQGFQPPPGEPGQFDQGPPPEPPPQPEGEQQPPPQDLPPPP